MVKVNKNKNKYRPVLGLPTPEGWKAELAWVFVIYRDSLPVLAGKVDHCWSRRDCHVGLNDSAECRQNMTKCGQTDVHMAVPQTDTNYCNKGLKGAKRISELRSVTCRMGLGSHCVTCHPTLVNALHFNPSQTGESYWRTDDRNFLGKKSLELSLFH